MFMEMKTGENDHGRRLDRILRRALRDCPLSLIHRLLRQGKIRVNGRPAKSGDRIEAGAFISVSGTALLSGGVKQGGKREYNPPPGVPLEILREADGLLILNKPAGIAVHGSASLDTLVQQYLARQTSGAENASLSFRAGPLHRLDKPTSGVIVFSSSLTGARRFSGLLREGGVRKYYLAIIEGRLEKAEIWQDALTRDKALQKTFCLPPENSAPALSGLAVTRAEPLAVSAGAAAYTLALAEIETGKTHQIRCQSATHGHPLAADRKYGGKPFAGEADGEKACFYLHAWKLEFDGVSVCAPPPEAFLRQARRLFGESCAATL